MRTPDPTNQAAPVPRRRRAVRLALIILGIAVLAALAASLQLNSR
jgi:ferric-dicitrate binding protein FerR (iron transport regulator)